MIVAALIAPMPGWSSGAGTVAGCDQRGDLVPVGCAFLINAATRLARRIASRRTDAAARSSCRARQALTSVSCAFVSEAPASMPSSAVRSSAVSALIDLALARRRGTPAVTADHTSRHLDHDEHVGETTRASTGSRYRARETRRGGWESLRVDPGGGARIEHEEGVRSGMSVRADDLRERVCDDGHNDRVPLRGIDVTASVDPGMVTTRHACDGPPPPQTVGQASDQAIAVRRVGAGTDPAGHIPGRAPRP